MAISTGLFVSVFALLVAVCSVATIVFLASQLKRPRKPRLAQPRLSLRGRVSGNSKRALYALLNGDRAAAQRLVQQTQRRHSERSEQWCWEKVIFDLKRDRRASGVLAAVVSQKLLKDNRSYRLPFLQQQSLKLLP